MSTPATRRPRIRAGAVIWGLALLGAALWLLWVLLTPGQSDQVLAALFTAPPAERVLALLTAAAVLISLTAASIVRLHTPTDQQIRSTAGVSSPDTPAPDQNP